MTISGPPPERQTHKLTTRGDAPILSHMVNYKERLDRTFTALVDPTRRAILAQQGTEITFTHSLLRDEETCRSHVKGRTGSLDKLEARFTGGEFL
jgi:hypothetical protein